MPVIFKNGEFEYEIIEEVKYTRNSNYGFEFLIVRRVHDCQWYVALNKQNGNNFPCEQLMLIPIGMVTKMLPDFISVYKVYGKNDVKDKDTKVTCRATYAPLPLRGHTSLRKEYCHSQEILNSLAEYKETTL